MDASFWHERWESGRTGFHQEDYNSYLVAHWDALGLPEDASVLVPMCGKSRDMVWLRQRGHRVLGVELSPIAVRSFFEENELSATSGSLGAFDRWASDGIAVLNGNIFDLTEGELEGVVGVYDRAGLIALPPEMRRHYAEQLADLLPRDARMLLVTIDYPQDCRSGPPFSVPDEEVRNLFGEKFEIEQLVSDDVLAENPRFQKDVDRLSENVYALRRI